MRIKPHSLWTFLINSSMKKPSDLIALIRNNFSNFMQNCSIIWLFLSSQPKISSKAYCFMSLAYVQSTQIFCWTPKMSRILMKILNIYFQSALPIWTDFTDSIYYWQLSPFGIWCANFKDNLKCYLLYIYAAITSRSLQRGIHKWHPMGTFINDRVIGK